MSLAKNEKEFIDYFYTMYIVNKIPRSVNINELEYTFVEKRLVVTDNREYSLDINEFGPFT